MKGSSIAVVVLLLALAAGSAAAQTGHDLFQQALVKERTEGDLSGAIALYERIVREFAADRPLAARVLVQMGQAYEKLGSEEARRAYERVLRDFGDQPEQVATARERLAALAEDAATESQSGIVARQVWAGGSEVDGTGTPSPDGRYFFTTNWQTGDLAVREIATGEMRNLTHERPLWTYGGFPLFPVLSPDQKTVATTWFNDEYFWELRLVGIDGDSVRTLYRNEEVYWVMPAGWTSNGGEILAHFLRKDGANQIAMVRVADGSARILKSFDWRQPEGLSLSPDGRFIAYAFPPREESQRNDIYLLSADGTREVVLVEHPANDHGSIWAPDGSGIFFKSDRRGTRDAWFLELEDGRPTGSPKLVKRDMPAGFWRGFTRDGSLFYTTRHANQDVFVVIVDPTQARILGQPTKLSRRLEGDNARPDWSPDGKSLVYRSVRGGFGPLSSTVLVIRSMETGEERELVLKELGYGARPRWSPDGQSILLQGKDKRGSHSIYRLDPWGELTPILKGTPDLGFDGEVVPGPDGKTIYYEVIHGNFERIQLAARNLETGHERILYTGDHRIRELALSPDGSLIAFEGFDRERKLEAVLLMPTTEGEPREIFTASADTTQPVFSIGGITWMNDGKGLLFTTWQSDPAGMRARNSVLWRVSPEGGEPEQLGVITEEGRARHLRLHPDGRRLAFTVDRGYTGEVWVLQNFLQSTRQEGAPEQRR